MQQIFLNRVRVIYHFRAQPLNNLTLAHNFTRECKFLLWSKVVTI